MSIPKIDPYPPAPTPEDDEATFDDKAYAHAASLEPRRVQMNEIASYVNTRASDANNRALAAASSATDSANSAVRADEWANKAPGSVVASGKYSARHYSDLSDKFANAPEDTEVVPGKYSAQHYMEKAKKIADVHATTVETDPLPTVLATNAQAAIRELAYQADQLRVARNKTLYGDGPYPVLDLQFQGAKYLDPRIQFTRASTDWGWEGNEYEINEPVLTGEGINLFGKRTNELLRSRDFGVSPWSQTGVTLTEHAGFTEVRESTSTGTHTLTQFVTPSAEGLYCFSMVLEAGDGTDEIRVTSYQSSVPSNPFAARFNLASGKVTFTSSASHSAGMRKLENGSFLAWVVGSVAPAAMSITFGAYRDGASFEGDGTSFFKLKSAQFEAGVTPTPHILTRGSQVTVAETRIAPLQNKSRTLLIDLRHVRSEAGNNTVYSFTLNKTNSTIAIPDDGFLIWSSGSSTSTQVRAYLSGSASLGFTVPVYWENIRKVAICVDGNKLILSINGVSNSTVDSMVAEVFKEIKYLNLTPAPTRQSKLREIKSVTFFNVAMSEEKLNALTALE